MNAIISVSEIAARYHITEDDVYFLRALLEAHSARRLASMVDRSLLSNKLVSSIVDYLVTQDIRFWEDEQVRMLWADIIQLPISGIEPETIVRFWIRRRLLEMSMPNIISHYLSGTYNVVCREIESLASKLRADSVIEPARSASDILSSIASLPAKKVVYHAYTSLYSIIDTFDDKYTVIGARPSVGKTTFALNMAWQYAISGKRVYFLSLEMSKESIARRFSCIRSERKDLDENIFINDSSNIYVEDLEHFAYEASSLGSSVFVVDYIQLLRSRNSERRDLEITAASAFMRHIVKKYSMSVFVLAQLNRSVESRGDNKPRLSDLRESGSLEQDADVVLFLYRRRGSDNILGLDVAKNRTGPIGGVDLLFKPDRLLFTDEVYNG